MEKNIISGKGRKRPQLNIHVSMLHLDTHNPRLPEEVQGQGEKELFKILAKEFDLRELAESMSKNGYFDEEPIIVVPKGIDNELKNADISNKVSWDKFKRYLSENKNLKYTVVEGNRRLATVKLLLDEELRGKLKLKDWPEISEDVKEDIEILPVIVYPKRESIMPYLGVRHISGIKKWEPFAKARYIVDMKNSGYSLDQIQQKIGDRSNSVKKIYLCWKLVSIMEAEIEGSTIKAKDNFSYLLLSLGQGAIKEYLGMTPALKDMNLEKPISKDKLENLKNLFSFLFGEGQQGKTAVIRESRDITGKLTHILRNNEATQYLINSRNIDDAYDLSGGEATLIVKKLKMVNKNLEFSLGIIHRHKTIEVEEEIKKCKNTLEQIDKVLKEE